MSWNSVFFARWSLSLLFLSCSHFSDVGEVKNYFLIPLDRRGEKRKRVRGERAGLGGRRMYKDDILIRV